MASPRKRRRPLARLVRAAAVLMFALILLPYLITPAYLVVPPVSTPMLWRWITGARVEREWVPIAALPPALPLSVIVAEDARFCAHWGIDWRELQQVLEEADDMMDMRGGSTISQQTAKNLFLWSGRSVLRKGLEFPLALWLDLILPKARLMEIYLNIAEWGPNGEFGAEAGARRAFRKSARSLTPHEAALLAAVLPNPVRRNAQRPGSGLRRLAGIYQARARAAPQLDDCLPRGKRP